MPVIEAIDLRRTYRTTTGVIRRKPLEVEAVRGITFAVERGELFGLLGPNGAGKTTTIKMLITLLLPTSGAGAGARPRRRRRRARGAQADRLRVRRRPRPLRAALGLDNLRYFAELYGVSGEAQRRRIDELLELVGLKGRESERVEGYSRGMRQRLHIARGLLHDPEVLFLDEPTIGVDPVGARELRADDRRPDRRRQDRAADDALHVRGRRALRPDRRDRQGPDRRRGHAARAEGPRRRRPRDRDRGLRRPTRRPSRGCARSTASRRSPSRTATRRSCSSSRRAASASSPQPLLARARRRRGRPRLVARADARGRLRGARHGGMTTAARVFWTGFALHFKNLSASPF